MAPVLGVKEVITILRAPLLAEQKTWKQNLALSDFFLEVHVGTLKELGSK